MQAAKTVAELIVCSINKLYGVDLTSKLAIIQDKMEEAKSVSFNHSLAFTTFAIGKDLRSVIPKDKDFKQFCLELAQKVAMDIKTVCSQGHQVVQDVQAEGPYLNFFLTSSFLARVAQDILDGKHLTPLPKKADRVMIEYSQPNTHKTFHVGHTRNAALGNALVRMFEFCGYDVVAANYIGDEGMHIAKCLWYYIKTYKDEDGSKIYENASKDLPRVEWLGELYAQGCEELELSNWTAYPATGVITAKVLNMAAHPSEPKWHIVTITTDKAEQEKFTVVTGAKGFAVGSIVAYAPVGNVANGRLIKEAEKKGIVSQGMLMSGKELEFNDDNDIIFTLPNDAPLGVELTEYGRKPNIDLPANVNLANELAKRNAEVKQVLLKMEQGNSSLSKLWRVTREWCLEDFRKIYEWFGCRFDHFFHESDVGEESKQIVIDAHKNGLLIKSEGAIVADLTKWKLGFVVLLTSAGTGLYATKDLALAKHKFDDFKIDRSVYVVDASQSLHFAQVFKTLEILGFKQAPKCYHLPYGLVVLPDGKMSSRKGNIITFSSLKEKLLAKIHNEFMSKYENHPDWSPELIAETTKKIAISTIKYGMLNQDNNKDIVFSMDEWTAKTGNTGPYIMYAYARTCSILREVSLSDEEKQLQPDWSLLTTEEERKVLIILDSFLKTVQVATENYRPQQICIFLFDLAKSFSRMFEFVKVKTAESKLKVTRLALVKAVGMVLKCALNLLGIETADRM